MTEPEVLDETSPWTEEDNPEDFIGDELTFQELKTIFDDADMKPSVEVANYQVEEETRAFLTGLRTASSWHVAPSLVRLKSEINGRWAKRDRTTDGSIGNSAHCPGVSDHCPNSRRSVNALDIDRDGINASWLVAQCIKHPSTQYVIFNRTIWSRTYGFKPRKYYGDSPHTEHVHVSIRQTTTAENSVRAWFSGPVPPAKPKPVTTSVPAFPGILKRGSKGAAVKALQTRLNKRGYTPKLVVDGDFGKGTETNLRAFQRFAHLTQDGVYGKASHKALYTLKIT